MFYIYYYILHLLFINFIVTFYVIVARVGIVYTVSLLGDWPSTFICVVSPEDHSFTDINVRSPYTLWFYRS